VRQTSRIARPTGPAGSTLPARPATAALRLAALTQALDIVAREYGDDLTIDEVAARVLVSRRVLQRAFDDYLGLPFRAHLTAVRMARAADLLATSAAPVQTIARQVGYSQPTQFAKAFRRAHGRSPSEHRALASERRPGQPGPS
jgi:AraC family transcriptional regulator, regulatory protein of adaptative response / methylphosphotriester-DNA alkyltransferase methyltransferase